LTQEFGGTCRVAPRKSIGSRSRERLETVKIDEIRVCFERVPRRPRDDDVEADGFPERRDVPLQRRGRRIRRILTPDRSDEASPGTTSFTCRTSVASTAR
jgi:hypothetical protein